VCIYIYIYSSTLTLIYSNFNSHTPLGFSTSIYMNSNDRTNWPYKAHVNIVKIRPRNKIKDKFLSNSLMLIVEDQKRNCCEI
jgi:hypothetical protein